MVNKHNFKVEAEGEWPAKLKFTCKNCDETCLVSRFQWNLARAAIMPLEPWRHPLGPCVPRREEKKVDWLNPDFVFDAFEDYFGDSFRQLTTDLLKIGTRRLLYGDKPPI